ncbi:hypothetical protein ABXZ88_003054 [Vibrio fluvialis]
MNYETATNIELNFELARKLNLRPYKNPEEGDDAVRVEFRNKAGFKWIDFCTDWNATMPLAVEHGLDIELPIACLGGIGQITKYIEGDTDIMVEFVIGDNPLRAIVICLIKVLEAKNDAGQKS